MTREWEARRAAAKRATLSRRRALRTLLAYLEAGSHRAAADRLSISESACRQRVSHLITEVGASNAAQASWMLRHQLEAEADAGSTR